MTFAAVATISVVGTSDRVTILEDAIQAWVMRGSGLDADHVIWSPEGVDAGPTPSGTYIALRLTETRRVSDDWLITRSVSNQITHHVRGTRSPMLQITCFAGARYGASRAGSLLDRVMTAAQLPTVSQLLRAADVGIGTRGPVRVISGTRSGMFDPRAIVEVILHTMVDVSEPGQSIEHVEATVLGRSVTVSTPPVAFSEGAFSGDAFAI